MDKTGRKRGRGFEAPSAKRLGFAFATALAGYVILADTAANIIVKAAPAVAVSVAPWNAKVSARALEQEYILLGAGGGIEQGAAKAKIVLREDATATEALNLLGFEAQLANRADQSAKYFAYSLKLSRRELSPRLWEIEQSVSRGDVAGALRNYDIALRTSRTAGDLLFPTLTRALSEQRIRTELLGILRSKPVWAPEFIRYAASSQLNPKGFLNLIREAPGSQIQLTSEDQRTLVDALAYEQSFDEAWSYFSQLRGGLRRDASRDENFAETISNPTVFDWIVAEYAWSDRDGDASRLTFEIPPTTTVLLARQYSPLPVGAYRLSGRGVSSAEQRSETPEWRITCRDGRELAQIDVPIDGDVPRPFGADFLVPTGCPVVALELRSRAVEGIEGVSGAMEMIRITPRGSR